METNSNRLIPLDLADTPQYVYWEINYISCESNKRWTIARTPADWDEYQVRRAIPLGGCGDDVAEIISIERTGEDNYSWDFNDSDL